MMKIKHKNSKDEEKVYIYPTTTVMMLIDTREKIRQLAKNDGRKMMTYMARLIDKEYKKLK